MATPLNIIGGWYSDEAKPWAQQDICNFIPFAAEQAGTLSPIKAVPAPGRKPYVEIASNGGIRGMEDVEGKLLVVAGTGLYQISNTGVAIPRGTIPGTGLVDIGYNQAGIANEVLIANDSAGYVYNTSTLTTTRITDEAFPGARSVDYLDSFLLFTEPFGRFWGHSDLANAQSYNALDRYESETSPDRIVTTKVSNEEAVVFNKRTTDFFVNTGAATGTFQSKGVSMTVGCAAAKSVAKLDNTLFWLDNYGVFQRLNGYSPQPISTRALESAISGFDWSKCRAMVYQDKGRKIVYWTFPGEMTIGYDVTTGLWHRLEAYGMSSDRLSCIVYHDGKWIGGDYINGRLYELDWDYMLQVDQPHVRRICTAPLAANGSRLTLHRFKTVWDAGGPETIAIPFPVQPDGPTISGDAPDADIAEESPPWDPYQYTIAGTAPLTVTLRSGTLPPGLTLTAAGLLTGQPTTPGAYVFTIRVTDVNGLWADLTDTIFVSFGEIIGAEAEYRYLQVDSSDEEDRSAADYDDSEWEIGESPYANAVPHPYAADVGWPNVKNTNWDLNTKLWLRANFNMAGVTDLTFYVFVDNFATVWVNGELAMPRTGSSTSPSGPVFNHSVEITADMLVVGDNVIAVLGEDMGVYSYMACRLAVAGAE